HIRVRHADEMVRIQRVERPPEGLALRVGIAIGNAARIGLLAPLIEGHRPGSTLPSLSGHGHRTKTHPYRGVSCLVRLELSDSVRTMSVSCPIGTGFKWDHQFCSCCVTYQKSAPSGVQRRLVLVTESPKAFRLVTVIIRQLTRPLSELF